MLPEIKCQPLAPWTCLRATESGDDDDFKGKQRRALRSLAGELILHFLITKEESGKLRAVFTQDFS